MSRITLTMLGLLVASASQAEIHTCEDEFGNVAYQQTPCPEVEEAEVLAPTQSVAAPADEEPAPAQPLQVAAAPPKAPEDVELCKEPLRDAIDTIEADMLRGYSAEQGEAFKQELRKLTQQMRACE